MEFVLGLIVGIVVGLAVGWWVWARAARARIRRAESDAASAQRLTADAEARASAADSRARDADAKTAAAEAKATAAESQARDADAKAAAAEAKATAAESQARDADAKTAAAEAKATAAESRVQSFAASPAPSAPSASAESGASGGSTPAPEKPTPSESADVAASEGSEGDIDIIEGIGPAYAERLRAAGVGTVARLLAEAGNKNGRTRLAEATGIADDKILTWVNHADLMRVPGVGPQQAELLEAVGVDSPLELARRNAGNLLVAMEKVNAEKRLVPTLPSADDVAAWVKAASGLARATSH